MDEIVFTDCPTDGRGTPTRATQADRKLHGQCVYCGMLASQDHRVGCARLRCRFCEKRLPNEEEAYWTKKFVAERGQVALDEANSRNETEFCVCSWSQSSLWRKNLLMVTAAVVTKYPDFEKNADTARAARELFKLAISNWIKGKPARNNTKTQRLKHLTDHGDSLFYREFDLVFDSWKTNLRRLLGSERSKDWFEQMLANEGRRYYRDFHAMAKFLSSLTRDPEFAFWLNTGLFANLNPYGFDPDGMKQKLYNDHPEYQAILDGIIEDHGYDECLVAIKAMPDGFGSGVPPDRFEDDWLGWLYSTRDDGLKDWGHIDGLTEANAYDGRQAALDVAMAAAAEAEPGMSYSELEDKVYWEHPELRENPDLRPAWYKSCDALPMPIRNAKTPELLDLRISIWGLLANNRFASIFHKSLVDRSFQETQPKRHSQTMKELLETITTALVNKPDQVQIRAVEGDRLIVFELRVHPSDAGKVIGYKGGVAESIKTIFDAVGTKVNSRIMVRILK